MPEKVMLALRKCDLKAIPKVGEKMVLLAPGYATGFYKHAFKLG
jgi:hypothetical protein